MNSILNKGYKVIEFDNQKEYATQVMKLITEDKMESIEYSGLSEVLIARDVIDKIRNYTHKKYNEWRDELKKYVIIIRENTTTNMKEYQKEYQKKYQKDHIKDDDVIRLCPTCSKEIVYKTNLSKQTGERNKTVCKECYKELLELKKKKKVDDSIQEKL